MTHSSKHAHFLPVKKTIVDEVAQRNQWEQYLPLVEYAYNDTVHTSTGKAPFEIIEGRPKLPLLLKTNDKIFAADEYVRDISVAFGKIKEAISHAQEKHKRAVDKHRRSLAFKENDWVLLRFTKARLRHTTGKNKQGEPTGHQKYYIESSFQLLGISIMARLRQINWQEQTRRTNGSSKVLYRLKLLASWHIHNAFHVSLLKPYKCEPPNEQIQEEPPDFDEQEEILWPEKILRHEDKMLRSGKVIRRYLIRFRNYPPEDAQWMQEPQLKDHLVMLQDYKLLHNL